MKNYSIWKDYVDINSYRELNEDINVDVLIIGGGMTGISTLYHLEKSGFRVALVEQNKIGMGVTSNTTGKITYLQDRIYNELLNNFDFDIASLYLKSQIEARDLILSIIEKNNIDCDLEEAKSYVYTNKDEEIVNLKELKDFLNKNNIKVFEEDLKYVESKYMIGVNDTYLFHPLKFIKGMLDKISSNDVYENTSIKKIENENKKYVCYTENNKIIATWVVIASHYPYFNLPFLFPIKGSLEKSYVSASKKKIDNVSLISYYKPVVSLRKYKDYMIYLELTDNLVNNIEDGNNYKILEEKLKKYNVSPDYLWSNIDIMTNDSLPYVGEINHNMYLGTGYNTWGMTNGVLAGKVISDLILNKDNKYVELFNPKRVNLKMFGKGVIDGYYNAIGFVKGYLTDDESVRYEKYDGKEIAIYKDDKGIEHKVYTKCPHLGCRLNFNQKEKTWDCPCHASRFDLDGKCISGPSNDDISVGR